MGPRHNLGSSSPLVMETIEVLRRHGGRASIEMIAHSVLQLPASDARTARLIIDEMLDRDPRFKFTECPDHLELSSDFDERIPLSQAEFVVVDLETTAARKAPACIMEIGACKVRSGVIESEFHELVDPGVQISPFISRLTGITDVMVKGMPLFREIVGRWLDFLGAAIIVGHNSPRDLALLNAEIETIFPGKRLINHSLCTEWLSRHLLPSLRNHDLSSVMAHFGSVSIARHRALTDARITAEILARLLEMLSESGTLYLDEVLNLGLKAGVRI